MAEITKEQAAQLENDLAIMKRSGLSQQDMDAYMDERLKGWGIVGLPGTEITNQSTIRTLAMTGGAVGGGLAAPALASRFAPAAINMLTRPLIAGSGEAIGQFLGDIATGGEPVEAAKGAALTGLIGGGTQTAAQGVTYGLGRIGGVEGDVIKETLSRGPIGGSRLALGKPAQNAELQLAERLQAQLRPQDIQPGSFRRPNLEERVPARLRAESKMRQFDKQEPVVYETKPSSPATGITMEAGVGSYPEPKPISGGVDTAPIREKILSMVRPNTLEQSQLAVNSYLTDLADRLPQRMTIQELDQFIVEHSKPLAGKFGAQQLPLPAGVKVKLLGAARSVRNQALPEAKADFAKASRQLGAMRAVAKRMLHPDGSVKESAEGAFKGFLRSQRLRQIFEVYEKETGNSIIKEADNLAMKRQWNRSDSKRAGYIWYLVEAFGSRPLAKVGVLASQPAGVGAAAVSAFSQAMERPNP